MPIYTYQCENCGVRFERQQSFSDPVLKKCPECSEEAIRKVYTPVGVFKGSGFYSTDNRSPSGTIPKKEKTASANSKNEKKDKKEEKDKSTKKTKEE